MKLINQKGLAPIALISILAVISSAIIFEFINPNKITTTPTKVASIASIPSPKPTITPSPSPSPAPTPIPIPTPTFTPTQNLFLLLPQLPPQFPSLSLIMHLLMLDIQDKLSVLMEQIILYLLLLQI